MSFSKKSDWLNTSLNSALATELQRMDDGLQILFNKSSTADKLTKAVKINDVSFDGSEDITVTADPTINVLDSNANLDTIFVSGHYYGGIGNFIDNKPADVDGFGLCVNKISEVHYVQQLISANTTSTSGKVYLRVYNLPRWTDWILVSDNLSNYLKIDDLSKYLELNNLISSKEDTQNKLTTGSDSVKEEQYPSIAYLEKNALKAYDLTEAEFWDKYNSGDLYTGMYTATGETYGIEEFSSEILISDKSPVLETDDRCYILSYIEDDKQSLTVMDKQGNVIDKCNPNDILPEPWNVKFFMDYCNVSNACIAIDDYGYIYFNAYGTSPGDPNGSPISYGSGAVMSVNTADLHNPDSWKWVTDNGDLMAFATYKASSDSDKLTSACEFVSPNYLNVSDGGVFGFTLKYKNFLSSLDNTTYVCYFKSGQRIMSTYPKKASDGGPEAYAVDKENNLLYTLIEHSYSDINHNYINQICVRKIDINGLITDYPIYCDSYLEKFDDTNELFSMLHFANSKLLVYISNNVPHWMIFDPSTGTYTNVRSSESVMKPDYNSYLYDTGSVAIFLSHVVKIGSQTSYPVILATTWDYINDTLLITTLEDGTDVSTNRNYLLNFDTDDCIVIEHKDMNNLAKFTKINILTHDIDFEYSIPSIYGHSGFIKYIGQSPKDNTRVFLSYVSSIGNVNYKIKIDEAGNITHEQLDTLVFCNTPDLIIRLDADNILLTRTRYWHMCFLIYNTQIDGLTFVHPDNPITYNSYLRHIADKLIFCAIWEHFNYQEQIHSHILTARHIYSQNYLVGDNKILLRSGVNM